MSESRFARFAARAGLLGDASLCQVVNADKAALEASYCDPLVREPFIAALALASRLARPA